MSELSNSKAERATQMAKEKAVEDVFGSSTQLKYDQLLELLQNENLFSDDEEKAIPILFYRKLEQRELATLLKRQFSDNLNLVNRVLALLME